MTDPDESRPGGTATPPPADPAPPAGDTDAGAPAAAGPPTGSSPPASDTSPGAPSPEPAATSAPVDPPSTAAAPSTPPPATPPPITPPPSAAAPPVEAAPSPQPAPAPTPTTTTATAMAASPFAEDADAKEDLGDDYDDYDDDLGGYGGPRWLGLTTAAGAGIVGIVTLQVLMALVEAFSLKPDQRFGVPDDILHRIGYPFGSLGSTAMFFLVLAAVLLALPAFVGEEVSDRQYAISGAALRTAMVLGALVALGSILAVRGSLHEYSAKDVAVPGFVRVQFTSFLLATLASSALAIFSSLAALRLRDDT